MQAPRAFSDDSAATGQVARLVARLMFGVGFAIALASALVYLLLPLGLDRALRETLIVACLVVAAVFAAAAWMARRIGVSLAASIAASAAIALATFVSVALGEGVHASSLAFFGVVVCAVGATAGLRASLRQALLCGLIVLGLVALEGSERMPPAAIDAASRVWSDLITLAFLLVAGVATSLLFVRVGEHYLDAAAEREQRFRGLLRLAADWYWEMDAQFRFTHISEESELGNGCAVRERLGRTPWEIADYGIDDETMDAHRADLESHRPFQGLLVRRHDADGRARYSQVSGEPRFSPRGAFIGFWGVGRDVTAEVNAREKVAASETRYRELFDRTPSPLVLHRLGRVLDANPAAQQMFGYPDLRSMLGVEIAAHCDDADSIARVRERVARLERMPVGDGVPPADVNLVSIDGRRLTVRAAGVRVDAEGGPATLSIYTDETDRLQADAALRRSEVTLSHLVATTPDLIALAELESGRLVMVNASFTRLLGFTAAEAVGRRSLELGMWDRPEDRQRVIDTVRSQGKVEAMPLVFISKSGARVSMLASAARFEMNGREHLVMNARDVTDRERTRRELEAILQNASIGIAFTRDQHFMQANPYFERLLGWPQGGLAGQHASVVWQDEADYREVGALVGPKLAAGDAVELERRVRRRDGSTFWARIIAQAVDPSLPTQGGTIWIGEDITERRRIEQALESARDAAEAANRAKSAFLANTSHEIRTPLNGLLGLAQLALRDGLDEERRQQYLRQILDSAQSLSDIINDILDLSKVEAGKLTLQTVAFDPRALLGTVQRACQAPAEARGLGLSMHIDPALPDALLGDPLRVRQILANYTSNALKFTHQGEVRIDASYLPDGQLRLAVSDTGPGIDRATLATLFEPFTQGDASTTRRYGGTGLGLSICRQLAALMGGRVGASSEPGRGSTFWAELPLPATAQRAPARESAFDACGDALQGARVLMVEDNPVNMMIAVATLELWGIEVAQASDGAAAIGAVADAEAAGRPFDAVLMDVQMPTMSGHAAARALRERHRKEDLPIIALTAAALTCEREEALAAGMNDFLTKPIDVGRLRHVLARWIGQRDAA